MDEELNKILIDRKSCQTSEWINMSWEKVSPKETSRPQRDSVNDMKAN